MRRLSRSLSYIAFHAFVLGCPGVILAQDRQAAEQGTVTADSVVTAPPSLDENLASSELPDSPGASWLKTQEVSPQQNSSQPAQSSSASSGNSVTTTGQDQAQKPQRPVGTAAAEAPTVNGVTAAEPAGVAIAPAKQRRVRTIVLKVGAMVGAGVAVGTVIALTAATSSKPPGAH
jgi:hypothetical protein